MTVSALVATTPFSAVDLGVVCPMANEAETAVAFVDGVLAETTPFGFNSTTMFVVLDRASRDRTRELLEVAARERPALRVIWAPESQGVADAYVRGYHEALDAGCDWILEIDAGFSHQPTDIPRFFDRMGQGFDCVFGSRNLEDGRNFGTLQRRMVSRCGTLAARLLLGARLTDMTSGFQLFRRQALEMILSKGIRSKGPFFQTEMKSFCRSLRVDEVPIEYHAGTHHIAGRAIKESCQNLLRLFRMRMRGEL